MKILNLLLMAFIVTGLMSCDDDKKEGCTDPISINFDPDAKDNDGSCEYGGPGGATELVLFPKFNNVAVVSKASYPDTAYIKFNAMTSPGTTQAAFDQTIVGDAGEDHLHIYNLKRGKYYVYITGWDTVTNKRVAGGMPVTISQATGVVNVNVETF